MRALSILLLVLLLVGGAFGIAGLGPSLSPQPAQAEYGCQIWAYAPTYGGGVVNGNGGFSCGNDAGARTLQVCVISNGVWIDCDTSYPTGYSGSRQPACYVSTGAPYVTTQVWTWLKGEDGSTQQSYSPTRSFIRCYAAVD